MACVLRGPCAGCPADSPCCPGRDVPSACTIGSRYGSSGLRNRWVSFWDRACHFLSFGCLTLRNVYWFRAGSIASIHSAHSMNSSAARCPTLFSFRTVVLQNVACMGSSANHLRHLRCAFPGLPCVRPRFNGLVSDSSAAPRFMIRSGCQYPFHSSRIRHMPTLRLLPLSCRDAWLPSLHRPPTPC